MALSYKDAFLIHVALWNKEDYVRVGDDIARITTKGSASQQFSICSHGIYTFASQNMRKPSRWTNWVAESSERSLTWVFRKGGGYAGRIEQEGDHVQMFKLSPDRLVFEGSARMILAS